MSDLNGSFSNQIHLYPFRVAYDDTDAGGIMYHGNYITWAERTRVALWHLFQEDQSSTNGQFKQDLENDGLFVARKVTANYLSPAKLYDILTVETQMTKWGNSSITFTHTFKRGEEILATVDVVLVYINRSTFRPVRVPDYWKTHF
ncbi:MAG: acyl-CoA thioesterase, partial [Alphaproteobacteria bacterium]|nr:acyl-CoA thioesterase [Alphaproteobacteria bacterium]